MKKRVNDYIFVALMVLCTVAFYFLCPWIQSLSGDSGNGHYAIWATNAKILHDGDFPLWNPYLWGGYSDVGHIHSIFYPILILLEYICWDATTGMLSYVIFPLYVAIHCFIAALGIYCIGRMNGKSSLVSFVVAMLSTYSGCFVFGKTWAYIFVGYCWIVWLLLFLLKYIETRRKKWIIWSGIIFGMVGLSATAQGTLFAVLIYFLIYIVYSVTNKKIDLKITGGFLISGLIGGGIASVELFPFLETTLQAYRYIPGVEFGEMSSKMPLNSFKEHVVDAISFMQLFGGYVGPIAVSAFALLLIIIGLCIKKPQSQAFNLKVGKCLMFFALLYSMGIGVVDIFWYIPGYNAIREAILYAPLIIIGGSFLMFEALQMLIGSLSKETLNNNKEYLDVEKCAIGGGFSIIIFFLPHMIKGKLDLVCKILVLVFFIFFFLNLKFKQNCVKCGVLLLTALCIFTFVKSNVSDDFTNVKSAVKKVEETNIISGVLFDEINEKMGESVDPNAKFIKWSPELILPDNVAGINGRRDCFAYLNPIYYKTYYLYQLMDIKYRIPLQNIQYILVADSNEDSYINWLEEDVGNKSEELDTEVYSSYDSLEKKKVRYIDTSSLTYGQGWMVNQIEYYDDNKQLEQSKEIINKLSDPEFKLDQKVLVDTNSLDSNDKIKLENKRIVSNVQCERFCTNKLIYNVSVNTPGILITPEFYYSGWNVRIDGEKTDLLQVDYAFRGVYVPAGTHTVEFYYFPQTLVYGICFFTISIVIIVICTIMEVKEKIQKNRIDSVK